ncbi:MAG TPA: type III pantothenate kinase [Balneolaceae bacterium]|nr:type III pantothenate kinase [Balneolaceae bacterium]
MILIEIGNTSVKAVRDESGNRSPLFKVSTANIEGLRRELNKLNESDLLLLSSVRKDLTAVILEESKRLVVHPIQYNKLGEIALDYESPETLGIDRVLACAGGVRLDQSDVVVVDAGTACTVDFMTAGYTFKGGVILPGLRMLRHSMQALTPELPQVDDQIPAEFPGRSTKDSIRIGLNGGFIHTVSSFIDQYIAQFDDARILITGGDGRFLQSQLQEKYNCTYHENLVFDGMLAWKELNRIEI